jgi:SAM-dependent methyltransferase
MRSSPKRPIRSCVYPESDFGGFTRVDGTIQFYERVRALLGEESVVLDIGCGRSCGSEDNCEYRRVLRDLRGGSRRVIGIDVDAAARTNPTIDDFRLMEDPRQWPVEDNSIDLAFCDYVMEHVEDPEAFFAEWRRVLKPGGYACLRTPNSWSYIALISRLIPNRFHAKVTHFAQESRKAEDVFPVYYRCNRRGKLTALFRRHGFDVCVYSLEGEPNYLAFSRLAYRLAAVVHRHLPSMLQSTLAGFARKLP